MTFRAIFLCMLLLSGTAMAALPPFPESKREFLEILNHNDLFNAFGIAEPIRSIEYVEVSKNEQDKQPRILAHYLVTSLTKKILVDVVVDEQQGIGPISFKLHFHEVMPKNG